MSITCCQAFAAPSRSCLPNARTMPTFSSVLVCFGSIASERSNCCQRPIRLVHVVVGDPEIGAGVDVLRVDLQRVLVPACVASGKRSASKYRLPSCTRDSTSLRVLRDRRLERAGARLVERRGGLRLLGRGGGCGGRGCGGPRLLASDHPADEDAEKHAGYAENDGFLGHGTKIIATFGETSPPARPPGWGRGRTSRCRARPASGSAARAARRRLSAGRAPTATHTGRRLRRPAASAGVTFRAAASMRRPR